LVVHALVAGARLHITQLTTSLSALRLTVGALAAWLALTLNALATRLRSLLVAVALLIALALHGLIAVLVYDSGAVASVRSARVGLCLVASVRLLLPKRTVRVRGAQPQAGAGDACDLGYVSHSKWYFGSDARKQVCRRISILLMSWTMQRTYVEFLLTLYHRNSDIAGLQEKKHGGQERP
jgi:hypothetical protein